MWVDMQEVYMGTGYRSSLEINGKRSEQWQYQYSLQRRWCMVKSALPIETTSSSSVPCGLVRNQRSAATNGDCNMTVTEHSILHRNRLMVRPIASHGSLIYKRHICSMQGVGRVRCVIPAERITRTCESATSWRPYFTARICSYGRDICVLRKMQAGW